MSDLAIKISGMAAPIRRIERAWLVVLALFAALALFAPAQARTSFGFTIDSLIEIAPFLLLAIAVAAYAKASGADGLIARAFHGRTVSMIAVAALFGGLSPFCSCGVIPLIAALLAMGVPLPAVMAFWLASPIMDPSMFVLTAGALGFDFAIAKTLAAIGLGLMGGYATMALMGWGVFSDPLRPEVGNGGCGGATVRNAKEVAWRFWHDDTRVAAFSREATSTGLFLLKWLTLAFTLESLMIAYVPASAVAELLGTGNAWAIPIAVVTGVPAYLNGYAALPLVAGLIDMGVAPGAGMAFMVAGGVTSIPAAIAVWALSKPQVFAWYIALSFTGALLAGFLFQAYAG